MTVRYRVAHVLVQPVLVIDDGENLAPGPQVAPQQIALSALGGLADQIRAQVEQLDPTTGQ